MIKQNRIWHVSIAALFLFFAGNGTWAVTERISNETYVIEAANQIRQVPLGHAESLRYDWQVLLTQQPWLSEVADGLALVSASKFFARNIKDLSAIKPDVTINTDYATNGANIIGLIVK
ncbi:MAG: hypothetical protein MI862_15415 [Desulfobacterales bacterium]|nr:hypothetical protein [Desulfobacterales bacterium]